MQDTILQKLKKIQGISHNEFDSTIQMWIDAGEQDLKRIGIVSALVDNPDNLVETAIITYALSQLDVVNKEMYENSYSYQLDTLRHIKEYIEA